MPRKTGRTSLIWQAMQPWQKAVREMCLRGVITGLLAQGMDGFQSAVTGVFLHACGGDEARDKKGGYSVLARDLIHGIQVAMKKAKECN